MYWPRPRPDQGPLREDRRHRQRRDAAVHRRVAAVRARADRTRSPTAAPISRSSPRRRPPAPTSPTAARPARRSRSSTPRPELRAAAPVGQPAGRLQRPGQRPADGAADQGRRGQALPRHPLLGLLGRPQHQDIPAAWQGQDLSQLTTTVQNYTRAGDQRVRRAGHPGRHGLDRQRDPQRHPVAGRPGRLEHQHRLGQPGHAAEGRRGRGARRQPARSQAARHAPLRPGRQQRRQRAVLRPHGRRPASRST